MVDQGSNIGRAGNGPATTRGTDMTLSMRLMLNLTPALIVIAGYIGEHWPLLV